MRTPLIILALLILSLLGNWFQWRSAEQAFSDRMADHERAEKRDLKRVEQLDSATHLLLAVMDERRADSIRVAKKESSYQGAIIALKRRVTGPAVVQDTIIVFQDSLIYSLQTSRDTLYLTDNMVFDSLKSINEKLKGMVIEGIHLRSELRQDLRDERRKNISLGPYIGADWRGVSVGVSVQYSLLRFRIGRK